VSRQARLGAMLRIARFGCLAVAALACHREAETTAVTVPTSATSPAPSSPPSGAPSVSAATAPPTSVPEGVPAHFKSGARGVLGGVTFTVRMLPKLMVSGPQPEIEQAQIDCERGSQRGTVQLDTLHKHAEWGDLVFELGYADVYHDDIELTVRRK
jgi:hypothetical protein